MMISSDEDNFILHEPNAALSKKTRSRIRRHAMKAVGAARRRPTEAASRYYSEQREPDTPRLLPSMPFSGLELLVRDRGLDPMDLSALTSVHLGTIASTMLQSEPSQLPDVLLCRQWSYFSFIPPRFGHLEALDDAFRCLVTMAHSMLVPDHKRSDGTILGYYGKALRSLQSAVDEPRFQSSSEVLCAAAILALCELLNSPNGQLWCHHIAGASRLVQLRGPARFSSEFDKALLMALSYPICVEALLNNEKCFLDDPPWVQALREATATKETFTDRSPLGIALVMLMARVPGLAKRTGHAVAIQDTLQTKDFDAIAMDVRELRSAVISWRRDFNLALIHAADEHYGSDRDAKADSSKRYELLGVALVVHILASRMLVCIGPNDRAFLEEEAQGLATELKAMQSSVGHNRRAGFLLAQKAKFADATIATGADFRDAVGSGRPVEAWRLEKFCASLGRRCCDGETCCQPEE